MPKPSNFLEPFDRETGLKNGYDDVVWLRSDAAVDDQQIAIEDPRITHGFTGSADEKRCRRPAHDVLIEVEFAFDMIISRARESGWYVSAEERKFEFFSDIGNEQHDHTPRIVRT